MEIPLVLNRNMRLWISPMWCCISDAIAYFNFLLTKPQVHNEMKTFVLALKLHDSQALQLICLYGDASIKKKHTQSHIRKNTYYSSIISEAASSFTRPLIVTLIFTSIFCYTLNASFIVNKWLSQMESRQKNKFLPHKLHFTALGKCHIACPPCYWH